MAQTPVVIKQSGGGMGIGVMLGILLVVLVGIGVLWFAMSDKVTLDPTVNVNVPAVNVEVPAVNVQVPADVKVPDNVTVSTPTP